MKDNRDVPRDQSDGDAEGRLRKRPDAQPDGLAGAGRHASDDDDFDFVVTEAHDQQAPQFLNESKQPTRDEDLGLESNADLMEDRAQPSNGPVESTPGTYQGEHAPIGQSEPPLPPTSGFTSEYGDIGQDEHYTAPAEHVTQPDVPQQPKAAELGPNEIGKLSAEEVASINKNLYGGGSYLSEDEKQKLMSSMDEAEKPFGNAPIEPPRKSRQAGVDPEALHKEIHRDENLEAMSESPRPTMANRQRGVAYFMKNYIQVQGSQQLMENDELRINDREYILRKKTFSPKVIAAVLGSVFLLLLIVIGSQFVSSATGGEGQIIGVVVDDMDRPFLQKAVIKFPDLGKSFKSNEQGFFKTGSLPQGNHKIEYTIDGNLIGVDYATVVGSEITTLVLKPTDVSDQQPVASSPKPASKPIAQASARTPEPEPKSSNPTQSKSGNKNSKSSKSSKQRYAKLVLAANVEGAKLVIDGDVIGAGNLTYTKLAPGKHSYSVTKDGFDTKTGSITLKADGTSKLKVELTPLTLAAKKQAYDADDFFHSGLNLLRDGKYKAAVADLSETIKKKPSHAEAHFGRAQAYEMLKDKQAAFDDYLRAAEIFQFRKDYNQAVTSYNKAIELDARSVAPLLGRANVYLSKGEQIAAIADFDAVIDRDKKNWQAQFGLGKARFEQGYYKKAVKHFKEARSLDSENAEIYQYLMLSYMGANDVKNVKKSYEKFTEVATDQQKQQFEQDNRFTAVRRVIDMES